MRIVLVEDDATIHAELAHALATGTGSSIVAVCESSSSAMAWLKENPAGWDLAIVDMFLREGHGFDVLKQCRRVLPQQRAVMFSNYSRDPAERQARAAGADRFFDKARDFDELIRYCRTLARAAACAGHTGQAQADHVRSSEAIAASALAARRWMPPPPHGSRRSG